ncbi:MAG: heme o synthase [Actinomycetota bacterium]
MDANSAAAGTAPTTELRVTAATRAAADTLHAYLALTKPRIIELLLVTTVPAMVLAAGRLPAPPLLIGTLLGGALAAGSANTFNCYLDRDIDALMRRTARRPLPSRAVSVRAALVFGLALAVVGNAVLLATTPLLAVALADGGLVGYVLGYTLVLKRRTAQNIVWGGAAGCLPVLVGWAAVTGSLSWTPWLMFLVVFFWTPPHFWALALRFRDDYARAGVPMLPVVAPTRVVTRQILAYTWATVLTSLVLWPVAGLGWLYAAVAAAAGADLLRAAYRLHGVGETPGSASLDLFRRSISYLTLLFAAVAVDVLVRGFLAS